MDKDSYKKMKKINSVNNKIKRVETDIVELEENIKENNIEIVLTTGPPHSMHLIGLKLKKILN